MNKPKKNNVVNFPSNLTESEREVEAILLQGDSNYLAVKRYLFITKSNYTVLMKYINAPSYSIQKIILTEIYENFYR
jgi:hypothetical protein